MVSERATAHQHASLQHCPEMLICWAPRLTSTVPQQALMHLLVLLRTQYEIHSYKHSLAVLAAQVSTDDEEQPIVMSLRSSHTCEAIRRSGLLRQLFYGLQSD